MKQSEQQLQQNGKCEQTQSCRQEQAGSGGGFVAVILGADQRRIGSGRQRAEDHHNAEDQAVLDEQPEDRPHNDGDHNEPHDAEHIGVPPAKNGL